MKVRKLACPCCGAKINKNQEKCDYCGASVDFEQTNENFNDNSTMEIRENGQNTQNVNIIIKNDTNSSNDLQKEVDEIVKNTEQPQKHTAKRIIGTIMIIAGICCLFPAPPAGIILLIVGSVLSKKKK